MARLFNTLLELDRLFVIPESDEVVNTETGEIFDVKYLENLKIEADQLKKYLGQEVLNLDADIEAYKKQKEIFDKKMKAAEKRKDSLKSYLAACLVGEPFEADDKSVKITFRSSESVNIISLDQIAEQYKTVKTEIHADKTAIKKAIKAGEVVEGAEIVKSNNIQIK